MTLSRAGRQADQIAADNEGLGPALRRAVGQIDTVAVREQPIRDDNFVIRCFKARQCGCGAVTASTSYPAEVRT